jgi:DHA1 family bicyclomycin/chloramphenicol resistance-like MFS transporter
MYLPAMPHIAAELGAGASQVQLTLTAFLIGTSLGQLLLGPLSDSTGRRRPLIFGLAAYTVISLACAWAPSVWALTGLRLLQALGAAAGIVISRAVVRDLYSGVKLAKTFSMLMLVMGLAPIMAPVLGAEILRFTSWRGVFVVLAAFGLLLLVASALGLPESLPKQARRPASLVDTVRIYGKLLNDRAFLGYGLSAGLAFAAMFAYIAGSSFVLQGVFKLSPQWFSVVFAVNALGIVVAGQVNGRLVGKISERRLLTVGLAANAVGGVVFLLAAASGLGLFAILLPLLVVVSSVGMIMPNSTALGLANHPEAAGSASALIGLLQFVFGGVAAPLVGLGGTASAVPMAVVMAAFGIAAAVAFLVLARRRAEQPTLVADLHPAHEEALSPGSGMYE